MKFWRRLPWLTLAVVAMPHFAAAQPAALRLLFIANAAPFSAAGADGKPQGYAVALCQQVAEAVRPTPPPLWSEATLATGLEKLAQGQADLLCGPVTDTLARENSIAFTSPIAMGGIGAILRPETPSWMRQLLGAPDSEAEVPRVMLTSLAWPRRIAVLSGGTSAPWLAARLAGAQVGVTMVQVNNYDEAEKLLATGKVGAWVGEWAVLAQISKSDPRLAAMTLLQGPLQGEPLAIALRPDPSLRRAVQAALSPILRGPTLAPLLTRWFGPAGLTQAPLIQGMTPPAGNTP